MLQDFIVKGSTDKSVRVRIIDSTDGTPETGVVFNTAGIDLWYRRELSAKTSITEATLAALTTAHADGGFLHIGDGYYRLDLPDAAFASGANYVEFGGTVTGMVVIGGVVKLIDSNIFHDAVRGGLTALPNAAADAAGGLPISDAGGLDLDAQRSDVAAILVDTGTTLDGRIPAALTANGNMKADMLRVNGTAQTAGDLAALITAVDDFVDTEVAAILAAVDTEVAAIKAKTDNLPAAPAATGDIPTAAAIADAVWEEAIADHSGTAGSTAEALDDAGAAGTPPTAAEVADAVWDETLADHLTSGTTGAGLNAAGSAGDPWGTALPGAYGAGTAGKIVGDNLNATVSSRASQTSVDTVDDFLDTEIAAIKAKTDNLPADPADASDIAASFTTLSGKVDTIDDFLDTEIAAIKAKTDQLTFTTANQVDAQALSIAANAITASAIAANAIGASELAADAVAEIQSGLSTLDAAGVRTAIGLASANLDTQLSTIDDFLDTEIAAILAAVDTEIATLVSRLTQALSDKLIAHAAGVLVLVVDTGSTTTAVVFKTVDGAAASATNDFYNGAVIVFTSGTLAGQRTSISDYDGATKTATVPALTSAPANNTTAVIV